MGRSTLFSWVALGFWIALFGALQASLSGSQGLGRLVPDLTLILVVASAARVSRDRLVTLAVVAAIARIGIATEPPVAVLFGMGALVMLVYIVRGRVDVRGVATRALLSFAVVWLFHSWSLVAHGVRIDVSVRGDLMEGAQVLVPAAVSGIFAFFFLPLLWRLPGLEPLMRRQW